MNRFKVFTFTGLRDLSLVRQLNSQLSSFSNVEHFMYVDEREFNQFPKDFSAKIRKRLAHDGNPFGGEGFRKKLYCMKDMISDVNEGDTWLNIDSDVKFKDHNIFQMFACKPDEIKGSAELTELNINGVRFNHMSGALQCLGHDLFKKVASLPMDIVNQKITEVDDWGYCPGDDVMISYFSQGIFNGSLTNYRGKINFDSSKNYDTSTADVIW